MTMIYYMELVRVCYVMSGHEILKYFCPILDKKDPPEDKQLYSIRLGYYRR